MWATLTVIFLVLVVGVTFAIKMPMFAILFEAQRDAVRELRRGRRPKQ